MIKAYKGLISFALLLVLLLPGSNALAQNQQMSLLLDAEIDDYVNDLAKPLLKAANLNPNNVHILVLNSPNINAFVNSQEAVFIMSGLILAAENANEVAGVIAHEIGHLKGHHLLRLSQSSQALTLPTLVGSILGLGAMAAGAPNAGAAVMVGSQAAGISSMLRFSRSQEQQADQIAVSLMEELNISTEGLKNFFGRLHTQNMMYHQAPPEYLMTHPKPSGRQNFLEQATKKPYTPSPAQKLAFERVKAKIYALTHTPAQTRRILFDTDTPVAEYGRAVAYTRAGDYDQAQASLQKAEAVLNGGRDPYFTELRGHIALERGDIKNAIDKFAKALAFKPSSTLIRYHYGRALLLNEQVDKAIAQLERVLQRHSQWWMAHQQLGLAYGKNDEILKSHISLAQAALYRGHYGDASFHLNVAEEKLKSEEDTNAQLQAQTIKMLKQELEKLRN